MAEHTEIVASFAGVDLAVAEHVAARTRSGESGRGARLTELVERKRQQRKAREGMAAGTLATEIIAREINAAKGKVERAEVEVSAIVDTILAEAATAVLAAMRNHESEVGRLRRLLIGAPLSGEMVLIAHDDLHAPSIRAGERAGHGPDPQRWADFRKALVADPDASFLKLEKSGNGTPEGDTENRRTQDRYA